MSRTLINFLLDATLLTAFLLLIWVSAVVRFVFPPGTSAAGWTLWGFGYDGWNGLQFALVAVLALGILLHVMLHWTWVCGVIASRVTGRKGRLDDGVQTLYGVGLLIVICNVVGLLVAAAALSIREPEAGGNDARRRAATGASSGRVSADSAAQSGHDGSLAERASA
jgi:hypothetical protein